MKCWCLVFLGLLAGAAVHAPAQTLPESRTPLDDYVHAPDPAYRWQVAHTVAGADAATVMIDLTSQQWRTTRDVDRTLWKHWLVVVRPAVVKSNKAFLMIGGGSNDRPMPTAADPVTMAIARATGSIVAELRTIPNQPLVFHNDGQPRKEDDLIAYAWNQFLETGDATWLPRLPMVKSVVRAMDCLQEWSAKDGQRIEKFVVAGGSKRGWTTWLTGAADPRVEAIVPIVIDVANLAPSLRHHASVYGFFVTAVGDYYCHRILQRPDHPRMPDIYRIVDPYYYRERLTMPKLILNASGDQFFCPDSAQFYFHDLKGEKLLRYVPNADHSLKNTDAVETLIAFHGMILTQQPRPQVRWKFQPDHAIAVVAEPKPKEVVVWQAVNPKARDFRMLTIGKAFTSTPLAPGPDGMYVARVTPPAEGWTAFFVELAFETGARTLKLTTEVRVLPETLPHADIDLKKTPYEPELRR